MVRLLLALLVPVLLIAAEVRLELPDPAVPGMVLQGELRVTDPPSNVTSVELPEVRDLEWQVNRTGTQTNIVNGQRSTTVQIGLVLRAASNGTYNIPPVKILLRDGTILMSQKTTLTVAPGDARLTGDLVGEVAFVPAAIVPGEQTVLTYRLWVRRGEVQNLGISPPEGAITLGERQIAKGRAYDAQGQEWTSVTVTWPLTFATPGPRSVRGQQEVVIPVGDGFFDNRVMRRQAAIAPATLAVAALPDAGRPADFTGLIGPVTAETRLERERVSVGEGVVLSFTVSGRQVDLVKRPALHLPGLQVYPKDEKSEGGSHVFRWDLVPTAPGAVTIPALAVPYFDPAGKAYRSATGQALTLTVIPGRTRDLGAVGAVAPATPTATEAPAAPILPAPRHGRASTPPPPWLGPVTGAAALLLGAGLGWWIRRPRRGPHRGRALRAAGQDPAALAAALAALRPALTTAEQRAAADRLQAAVDAARFGGQVLGNVSADRALLEALP